MVEIVGILLAAGSGMRFGADKLMLPLPNKVPIAVQSCRNLMSATKTVTAVVRNENRVLAERLQLEGAMVKVCEHAEQGMGTSLAFGVSCSPSAYGWLIALADMPAIKISSIQKIADAIQNGALIAAPSYRGRRGHPVGFSGKLLPNLIGLKGETGGKKIIDSYRDQICSIDCDDPGILADIDYPEDLKNINFQTCLKS